MAEKFMLFYEYAVEQVVVGLVDFGCMLFVGK